MKLKLFKFQILFCFVSLLCSFAFSESVQNSTDLPIKNCEPGEKCVRLCKSDPDSECKTELQKIEGFKNEFSIFVGYPCKFETKKTYPWGFDDASFEFFFNFKVSRLKV